jgi:serine/threonine-protein kinase
VTALAPGTRLGRFEITGVLGEGAMGIVYLAHDPQIERPVALKTLRPEALTGGSGDEMETRFLKEAKLAGRLSHPNVVTIYEAGEDKGVAYIAMEHVDGEPLTRFLKPGSELSLADRIAVVRQVAMALDHAHERGVLHRDIKPGNILITRDRHVKVADFGIGKLLTASTGDLTRTGHMIGSPAYMSPEQVRGDKLDGRSDLFSLAVVLYELLTGTRPFPGDSITTLVYQILHTEPRDPLLVRSDLPPATTAVFQRLLAKAPENRPANAREFLGELARIETRLTATDRTIAASAPPAAPRAAVAAPAPVGGPPASGRPAAASRSSGAAYLFGAAAVILAAAALVWIWKSTSRREERTNREAVATPPPATASPVVVAAAPATPPATAVSLPTAGPSEAADAIVGAPRIAGSSTPVQPVRRTLTALARTPAAAAQASPRPPPTAAAVVAEAEHAPSREPAFNPDNVYRTRRNAKFGVSPDQARIYLDGRYVGIADDWDDHGGGKTLPIGREGSHRVRVELPGYRTLNLEVVVTSSGDDTVDINDELKRISKEPYPKIPKVDDSTVGPVAFTRVEPESAQVSEGDKTLGPASSFGPGSPLKLSGPPLVHELVVSAPGFRPKTLRILVAGTADNEVANVKVSLKKE